MIPRGPTENGVCLASVIDTYLSALVEDRVDTPGNSPLIRTGRSAVNKKPSVFVKTPIGVNYLYDIGKDMAKFLQLAEPNTYTGHCFRRSSATELANNGATVMEMKQKFHWQNDKMPLVYVANSNANQTKMAQLLSGVDANSNVSCPPTVVENPDSIKSESSEPPAKRQKTEEEPKKEENYAANQLFTGNCKLENCTINVTFSK